MKPLSKRQRIFKEIIIFLAGYLVLKIIKYLPYKIGIIAYLLIFLWIGYMVVWILRNVF